MGQSHYTTLQMKKMMWVQEVFWMTIRMCDASVTCTVLSFTRTS